MPNDITKSALAYIEAWKSAAEPGVPMTVAKMKCVLAEGPCGCPEDSTVIACTGPYPPVPVEVLLQVLKAGVEGVQAALMPAPEAIVVDGHVHFVDFVGPATALYITKL